jgi:hypothetical protein
MKLKTTLFGGITVLLVDVVAMSAWILLRLGTRTTPKHNGRPALPLEERFSGMARRTLESSGRAR